jgi:hypothetical protein
LWCRFSISAFPRMWAEDCACLLVSIEVE